MTEQYLTQNTITSLYEEINALRNELGRFRSEVTNNKTSTFFDEFRSQCAVEMINVMQDDATKEIEKCASKCTMWSNCRPVLTSFFEGFKEKAKDGMIAENDIIKMKSDLDHVKEKAVISDNCKNCVQHVESYFDKQVKTLKKIGVYRNPTKTELKVQDLPEDNVTNVIGDPLSSPIRVRILKALYDKELSFTNISKLTSLRGGNLLFHLDKLQDSGLIWQREERGEYQISLRGYEVINTIVELLDVLKIDDSKKEE